MGRSGEGEGIKVPARMRLAKEIIFFEMAKFSFLLSRSQREQAHPQTQYGRGHGINASLEFRSYSSASN